MSASYDLTIYPAQNGYQVTYDRYDKTSPTVRYNAATIEDAVAWVAAKLHEAEAEPEAQP